VSSLVGDQAAKLDAFDQRGHANRIVALAREENEL